MEKLAAAMVMRRDFKIAGIFIAEGEDRPINPIKFCVKPRVSNHGVGNGRAVKGWDWPKL